MNNYKFRFRSRDWTQFDEADFMKKMKEAEAQGVPPDEFLDNVGMSRDEVNQELGLRIPIYMPQNMSFICRIKSYCSENLKNGCWKKVPMKKCSLLKTIGGIVEGYTYAYLKRYL